MSNIDFTVWQFYSLWAVYSILSIAIACVTVRLNMCSLAWPLAWVWTGPVREIRSSDFRRVCYRINILGSQLSPISINLVPAQAGKVTVGLASHWPCVTDTVVHPPTGSMAKDGEMSTHAYDPLERGTIYLLPGMFIYQKSSLQTAMAVCRC